MTTRERRRVVIAVVVGLVGSCLVSPRSAHGSWPGGWYVLDSQNAPVATDSVVEVVEYQEDGTLWLGVRRASGTSYFGRGDPVGGHYAWTVYESARALTVANYGRILAAGGIRRIAEVAWGSSVWTGKDWYDGRRWHTVSALDGENLIVLRPPVFDAAGLGYSVVRYASANAVRAVVFDTEGGVVSRMDLDETAADQLIRTGGEGVWAVTARCLVCVSCRDEPTTVCLPEGYRRGVLSSADDVAHVDSRGRLELLATGERDPIYVSRVARARLTKEGLVVRGLQVPRFQLMVASEWNRCNDNYYIATDRGLNAMNAQDEHTAAFPWPDDTTVGGWRDMQSRDGWLWLGGVGGVVGGRIDRLGSGFDARCDTRVYLPISGRGGRNG